MDIKQCFFDNLLMLDFDPHGMSSKHYVTFNKDMFVMPNHRAFQFVTHFLFQRLDKTAADEAFRHCWPIGDKRAEAEFRKVACNWLVDLSSGPDEEMSMPLPRIVPSLFMSPGGDKFYYLMFAFSRLVLARISMRECGIKPHQLVRPPLFGVLPRDSPVGYHTYLSVAHAMVVAERSQFVQELDQLHSEQTKWGEATDRFVASYRSALRGDKGCEENLKSELEAAAKDGARLAGLGQWSHRFRHSGAALNIGTPGSSAAGGRMAQRAIAERVRKYWRRIEDLWTNGQTIIRLLDDTFADRSGPNGESMLKVDGSMIAVRLPDILVHRLEEMALDSAPPEDEDEEDEDEDVAKIAKIMPIDLYDRGRLNLVAVVRFIALALNVYSEQLSSVVANGDFSAISESLTNQLPGDCRYLKQMIAQLRDTKKNTSKINEKLHKCVQRILEDSIYRLPATISSLSSGKDDHQPVDNDTSGISPSFFASNKNKCGPAPLQNSLATPANVPKNSRKHLAAPTTGFLDLSGGPNDLDLVPMTPLAVAHNSKPTVKQMVHLEPTDENESEDLLIDLSDFSR